ncbi:MAG: polyphosphate kinase 1 [Granulosicoccaceae bacterium]|jgi:polyphosphate kinase
MDTINLKNPELYINRELSMLRFNWRVLAQAMDENTPLLERLRFLCISSTNLDEFFEIRVAGMKQKAELRSTQAGPDNMSPQEVLNAISEEAHELVNEQYRILNEVMFPLLEQENIRFIRRGNWNEHQEAWLRRYFLNELSPVLSPLGLDPAHPFPRILNKSLNFIVSLQGKDAFGRNSGFAVVQAPRSLPRLIQIPTDVEGTGPRDYVFLSSVIHAYVSDLFPGMQATGCYQFRMTRNSDMFVDDEEIDDLMRAVEGELLSRRYGASVRLEVAHECPKEMSDYLLKEFELNPQDLYQVNGPVNLNRLLAICDIAERPELNYPPFTPGVPRPVTQHSDIFSAIRNDDILLHHPFESFTPVVDFVRQAASDPDVLAIKQTLYRTGPDSAVANALVKAAQAGKEVVVVIELRARFDEEANIALATRLQEAGAHVVFGVVGYKTHAKMLLVVRREGRRLVRYVHLGTGNYHPRTARLYTDYGLLTCDKEVGQDVHKVFMQLTSLGKASKMKKLLQSPFTLFDTLMNKIEREAENARKGKSSRIIIKVNGLIEANIIKALYEASQAGVKIDLIVRGICCLTPGIPGVSENIQVRSIIGRFLEHTRIYYFENAGKPEVYCSSADLMDRNLHRRVETCFPIGDERIRKRIIKDLDKYLKDNSQAWLLQPDGSYKRLSPTARQKPYVAQQILLEELAEFS